jgi:nucleotidyltransferase substrate binding protein (TIGR01987 family)
MSEFLDLTALKKAFSRFEEGRTSIESDLERDGAIQRFEYTFELSWKMMRKFLFLRGVEENSPKQVIRAAAQNGLIASTEGWFRFLEIRNLSSHTYREECAKEVESEFDNFSLAVRALLHELEVAP